MPVDPQTSRNNRLVISGKTGKVDQLREMLAQGVSIDVTDGQGTALMYASARGHRDYVAEILRLGADIHRTSGDGKTAVELAAEAGHREIVDLLIVQGARYAPYEEATALRDAIAGGLDVNSPDPHGVLPLLRAADRGQELLVEILLDHGADPQATTRFGDDALTLSMYKGHAAVVERLFRAGATLPDGPLLLPSLELLESFGVAEVVARFAGLSAEDLGDRRIRVPMVDLTQDDLERHPFWETCGDEDDDTHVYRPVPFVEPLEHDVIGLVRVEFLLADGDRRTGYAAFYGFDAEDFVRDAQPCLASATGWIDFYFTSIPPTTEQLAELYRRLGKSPTEAFPIRVRSAVELKDQPREGIVEGFAWIERLPDGKWATRLVR